MGRRWLPIFHGPRSGKRVALTFDDGPNDPYTLRIADCLEAHGARGTFFMVGKAAEARPDIARALVERGHRVANHAYLHRWRDSFVPGYPQLSRGQRAIADGAGVVPAFFRPPYGLWTTFIGGAAARQRVRTVLWDVMGKDWATLDSAAIASRVLRRAKGGSIILLHDGRDGDLVTSRAATARALPAILSGLADRALEPVRLDELLGGPAYL